MYNKLPSKETVDRVRAKYPEGTRVELISMIDPYTNLKSGDKGTVDFVDDIGSAFCNWDQGSTLAVVYGVDEIRKIDEEAI